MPQTRMLSLGERGVSRRMEVLATGACVLWLCVWSLTCAADEASSLSAGGKHGFVYVSTALFPMLNSSETPRVRCRPWAGAFFGSDPKKKNHGYVLPSPVITNGPRDSVVFASDHGGLTLHCDSANSSGSTTTWHFQRLPAQSSSKWIAMGSAGFPRTAGQQGSSLVFDPAVAIPDSSEGLYRCKVSVPSVGAVVSRPASLALASFQQASWQSSVEKYQQRMAPGEATAYRYLQPGSSLLLACAVGDDWPAYRNITWTLDGAPVAAQSRVGDLHEAMAPTTSSAGRALLVNGTLLLWSLTKTGAGTTSVYQCHATSLTGRVRASSPETYVVVTSPGLDTASKPSVQLLASNRNPVVGDAVVLTCELANLSWTGAEVFWSFRGVFISKVEAVSDIDCRRALATPYMVLSSAPVLVVCNVSLAMAGEYSCTVAPRNQHQIGVEETLLNAKTSLTVQGAPHWNVTVAAHHVVDLPTVFPGHAVTLDCLDYLVPAEGSHVQWFYNGVRVKHGSGAHAWTLRANNSQPGLFQCTVLHRFGYATVTYRLRVPGKPATVETYACNADASVQNPVCWDVPESYDAAITHYYIAQKGWRVRHFKHVWRVDWRLPTHRGIYAEVCRDTYYRETRGGCTVAITACNQFGCGEPKCAAISNKKQGTPMGFHNLQLLSLGPSSIFVRTQGTTGNLICKAFFKLKHPTTGHLTQYIKDDICDSEALTDFTHTFSNLESCTEYSACIAANLSSFHAGLDITDVGSMWCDGLEHLWMTVKTNRSKAPNVAPVVEQIFRAGRDSIIIYKASLWCDTFPHTLFQWSYTTTTHSGFMRPTNHRYYVQPYAPPPAGQPSAASPWFVQTGLPEGDGYGVVARSCSFERLKSETTLPDMAQCSSGVQHKHLLEPAPLTTRARTQSSQLTVTSSWTVNEALRERVALLYVHHVCQQNTENLTTGQPQSLSPNTTQYSLILAINASESVQCRVWLTASLSNISTPLQMSQAQTVIVKGDDGLQVEMEPVDRGTGNPTSNSDFFKKNWIVMTSASLALLAVIVVLLAVRYGLRLRARDRWSTWSEYLRGLAERRELHDRPLPRVPAPSANIRENELARRLEDVGGIAVDDDAETYGDASALLAPYLARRQREEAQAEEGKDQVIANPGFSPASCG